MRYGTGVALTLSAVQVDILSHRCCVDTKRDHARQENNSRLCGIWGKIWRALGTKKNTKVTLRYGTGVALTLSAVQVDILSHRCCVDTKRGPCSTREQFTFMWNLRQNLESSGHQEKHKSHTSTGRNLRLLKVWVMTWSVPDRIIMSILRGRCGTVNIHPVLNLIKLFPGGNWPGSCWLKGF